MEGLTPIESLFANVGLRTPMSRGAVTAGITAAGIFALKPALFFANGEPRGFGTGGGTETLMPWYVAAGAVGLIFGVLL